MRELDIPALKKIAERAIACTGYIIQCSNVAMMEHISATRPSVVLELIRRIETLEGNKKPLEPIPCKRCGCKKMSVLAEPGKKPGSLLYAVQCLSCVARGPFATTREDAIGGWNTHCAKQAD